jgi:hypothetical protein
VTLRARLAAAIARARAGHRRGDVVALKAARKALVPAPRPYALTSRQGHTLDVITHYALYAVEARLGYRYGSLDVLQGSYNAGGVKASGGTHDGGGAVDLSPANWPDKVHALRAVGFAAWHRPAIPGLWGEHVHAVLIGNAKLSPAARAQVDDYRHHRNGLADHGPDNTWHPVPIPTFSMPTYRIEETP